MFAPRRIHRLRPWWGFHCTFSKCFLYCTSVFIQMFSIKLYFSLSNLAVDVVAKNTEKLILMLHAPVTTHNLSSSLVSSSLTITLKDPRDTKVYILIMYYICHRM